MAASRGLESLLVLSQGLPERSGSRLEASRSALGAVLNLLERSWSRLEASRSALGAVSRPLGAVLSDFEAPVAPTSVFSMFFEAKSAKNYETHEASNVN